MNFEESERGELVTLGKLTLALGIILILDRDNGQARNNCEGSGKAESGCRPKCTENGCQERASVSCQQDFGLLDVFQLWNSLCLYPRCVLSITYYYCTYSLFCVDVPSEFIYGHLKEHSGFKCTENVTRRYKFYDLTTFLATNKDWTSAAFQDVLDTVTELVRTEILVCKKCFMLHLLYSTNVVITFQEAVCVNCPSNAQGKWAAAKMDIVFQVCCCRVLHGLFTPCLDANFLLFFFLLCVIQIGLAFLRETVDLVGDELPEDPSDLVLPAQISVLAYEDKIEQIFTLQEEVYDTESGEPSDLYETHIRTLTDNITESVAAGAKGKKNAPKKKMLSKQKVYELLSENRLKLVVNQLIHFVQTMETTVRHKYCTLAFTAPHTFFVTASNYNDTNILSFAQVLPVPLDVDVREYKEQETVASALKRMSHKPDWTDKEAETAGPYASRKPCAPHCIA